MTSPTERRVLAAGGDPVLMTVPNVPIMKTGEYQLSTGPATFTLDDLLSAAKAVADPGIRAPRLKIDGLADSFEAGAHGGEPSVGVVENLRVDLDEETLYGDFVGVPRWLGEILESAYPNRSIEGFYEAKSVTGKTHKFVVDAVALLGVDLPGISTLEDIRELFYAESASDLVSAQKAVNLVSEGAGMAAKKVAASIDVEDVRRKFYETLGSNEQWWWVRSVQLEPNTLIVDDDEGTLYQVPFTVSGEEISFGDRAEVKMVYETVAASNRPTPKVVAEFTSRGVSRPQAGSKPNTEDIVDLSAIRQKLGLPDDATEEQILARLDEQQQQLKNEEVVPGAEPPGPNLNDPAKPDAGTPSADPNSVTPPTGEGAPKVEIPEGFVLVDEAQLAEITANAARGAQFAAKAAKDEDEKFLSEAVVAGKFPRSRIKHYESLMAKDRDGTREFISQLASGVIPVAERGSAATGLEETRDASSYPAEWLPEVAARKAAMASGAGRGLVPGQVVMGQEG